MALESSIDVKKYFHDDDVMVIVSKNHPLKERFDRCNATNYVRRAQHNVKELIFRCSEFGGLHIVRECKDNCPKFKMCTQISTVLEEEAIIEALYPMLTE